MKNEKEKQRFLVCYIDIPVYDNIYCSIVHYMDPLLIHVGFKKIIQEGLCRQSTAEMNRNINPLSNQVIVLLL